MRFSVDEKTIKLIADYLARRPYLEVFKIIMELNKDMKPIEEEQE